jgi:hypothetical protein
MAAAAAQTIAMTNPPLRRSSDDPCPAAQRLCVSYNGIAIAVKMSYQTAFAQQHCLVPSFLEG